MEPFTKHRGKAALIDWNDVNTDLIIPARYLKRIERTGYGPLLFADKRYAPGGAPEADAPEQPGPSDPAFPLNQPKFQGASILVVGRNFGCGSSREHAVWAVAQAGYRAVIAPGVGEGFADIFEGNAMQNGLLPIELPESEWRRVAAAAAEAAEITVELAEGAITVHDPAGEFHVSFSIPEAERQRLLLGLDAVGETLLLSDSISDHERRIPAWSRPTA